MKHAVATRIGLMLLPVSIAACLTEHTPGSNADVLVPDPDPLFLVQNPTDGERTVMEALYEGFIVERDGCFRLGDEPNHHTVVWPPGFSLTTRAGVRVVLDARGRTVGQIGGFFRLGGGEVATLWKGGPVNAAHREVALQRCPGRYWIVGEVPAQ